MTSNLFRGDKADVFVHFTSGVADTRQRGVPCFVPGDTVSGYVEITPAEDFAYKKLLVRVKWRTEGKGDTDEVVWYTIHETDGALTGGIVKTIPFVAVLPGEPWSFAGRSVNIVWGVDVEIDVAWATNPRHFAPFVLAPTWTHTPER